MYSWWCQLGIGIKLKFFWRVTEINKESVKSSTDTVHAKNQEIISFATQRSSSGSVKWRMTEGRSDSRELRAGFSFDLSIKIEILEMLLQIKRIVLTFVVRLGVSSKSHAKKTSLLYWFQRISSGLSLTSKSWKMKGSEKKIRLMFVVRELG